MLFSVDICVFKYSHDVKFICDGLSLKLGLGKTKRTPGKSLFHVIGVNYSNDVPDNLVSNCTDVEMC